MSEARRFFEKSPRFPFCESPWKLQRHLVHLFPNSQSRNKEALQTLKSSHRMGDGPISLKTSAPHSLMTAYQMSLISAGSISLDSTFKISWPSNYSFFYKCIGVFFNLLGSRLRGWGRAWVLKTASPQGVVFTPDKQWKVDQLKGLLCENIDFCFHMF
jgi:hypothetical protein